MEETKSLFKSKTFWVNAVGGLLIPLLSSQGIALSADEIALLFGGVNIVLRLVTSVPVRVFKPAA